MILRLCYVFVSAVLASCTTLGPVVSTKNTAFFIESYSPKGTISVLAKDARLNGSLEFSMYRRKFEDKLSLAGYIVDDNPQTSDFIALISYGIDNGKSSTVSVPIFGQTGGGTTQYSGSAMGSGGYGTYNGTIYEAPTFGIVGNRTQSITKYKREIMLDIFEADSFKSDNPKLVYQGKTSSKGSCSIIAEVFDEMLEAMFTEFPGRNGMNRSQSVVSKADC